MQISNLSAELLKSTKRTALLCGMSDLPEKMADTSLEREQMLLGEEEDPATPKFVAVQVADGKSRVSDEDWAALTATQRKRRNQRAKHAAAKKEEGGGATGTGGESRKRPRVSDGSTPVSQKGGEMKRSKPKPGGSKPKTQAEEAVKDASLKLAVVSDGDGPNDKLDAAKIAKIHKFIGDQTDKIIAKPMRDGETRAMPAILRMGPSLGSLLISCGDAYTKNWIETLFRTVAIWPGAKLRVIQQHELAPLKRLRLWMPNRVVERAKILPRIAGLNKLSANKWEILTHEIDHQGTVFVFGVKDTEWDALKAANFEVLTSTGCFSLIPIKEKGEKQSGGGN